MLRDVESEVKSELTCCGTFGEHFSFRMFIAGRRFTAYTSFVLIYTAKT
jgi:hypothetical protein